jgi:predicted CoA-binding protein
MAEPSVAVIGASNDRRKFGNKAVRAYLESGYKVFPVNPREESVEGIKAYRSVEEIGEPVEIVSLYVPPAVGIKMLEAIAKIKPREVWLNPGSESDELIEAAADLHLRTAVACSITALGMHPEEISDN